MSSVRLASVLLILSLGIATSHAQSPAHEKSAYAIIDPVYSAQSDRPESNISEKGARWIYGSGELESWRLRLLMARKDSAELRVGYPGTYHVPHDTVSYRLFIEDPVPLQSIRFRVVGSGTVLINGDEVAEFSESDTPMTVSVADSDAVRRVRFDLVSDDQPPALLVEDEELSTLSPNWQWKGGDDGLWEPADHFRQTDSGVPPHRLENPKVDVQPTASSNGLYDFGRELLAFVVVESSSKPVITLPA